MAMRPDSGKDHPGVMKMALDTTSKRSTIEQQASLTTRLKKFSDLPIGSVFMCENHMHETEKMDLVKVSPSYAANLLFASDVKKMKDKLPATEWPIRHDERVILLNGEVL